MANHRTWLRWSATLALLAVVFWLTDLAAVVSRFRSVDLWWLMLALAVTPLQVAVSAWRWRYTVARLGGHLPLGHAIGEYYLATLVNQLVPGGVVGDAGRIMRHSRVAQETTLAMHGVMIERLSGQLVLILLALPLILLWVPIPALPVPGLALTGVLLVLMMGLLSKMPRIRSWWSRFRGDCYRALLAPEALPVQLVSSVMEIGSYLLVFWCLAMGLGIRVAVESPWLLMALCTVLLVAMVVPLTMAGWGVREGAAALLWPLAGLDPAQGVALSVCYGLVVLASSLPGAMFLLTARKKPDQTAYRCQD